MVKIQENMVKGKIAEVLVSSMFEDLGFEVVHYGYEHTVPSIANKNSTVKGRVCEMIRRTPDFIIVDKVKNAYFIEVKYRADGEFEKPADYLFPEAFFILLS